MTTALDSSAAVADTARYLNDLHQQGWAHLPRFLSAELVASLRLEAVHSDSWQRAGVGLAGAKRDNIRRDRTLWFDGQTEPQAIYLDALETVRLTVNRAFFAGLFEYEAHFAHYPPGAFYRKHVDALRGRGARVLTSVCYLNPQWCQGDGGELILYNEQGSAEIQRIAPRGGDLLLFWSERFPHEVLPAITDRYSIAGWFRRNIETANPL